MKNKSSLLLIITSIILVIIGLLIVNIFWSWNYDLTEEYSIEGFNNAEKFIEYGYPEIKTLSIRLLTLLSAILVFSITFSEKVVNFNSTNRNARIILFIGWSYLIIAIITDGLGLAYNGLALPFAIVDNFNIENGDKFSSDFFKYSSKSIFLIIFSGYIFILCLISFLLSAIISNRKK